MELDLEVICIKTNDESWDTFNENTVIKGFPKRIDIHLFKEGLLGTRFDTNVEPSKRYPKFYKDISRWATHLFCIGKFVKESEKQYLFVCESDLNVEEIQVANKTVVSYDERARAYSIDRETARVIIENSLIYYTPFPKLLEDLEKLNLIKIEKTPYFNKIQTFSYIPVVLFVLFLIFFILLIFYPFYIPYTKRLIGLAEVLNFDKSSLLSG
jgi:hypothetical protein